MTGITLDTTQAQRDTWILAETNVASGQAYQIGGHSSMKRADLSMIAERVRFWNARVLELSRNDRRQDIGLFFAVPPARTPTRQPAPPHPY